MADRRLFSADPFTGITKYFHWDDSNDTFLIETEMAQPALEDLIEANKQDFNDAPKGWDDGKLVARIPLHIYWDLKKKGITEDPMAMRRWLNDPDNRFFRTFPGTV